MSISDAMRSTHPPYPYSDAALISIGQSLVLWSRVEVGMAAFAAGVASEDFNNVIPDAFGRKLEKIEKNLSASGLAADVVLEIRSLCSNGRRLAERRNALGHGFWYLDENNQTMFVRPKGWVTSKPSDWDETSLRDLAEEIFSFGNVLIRRAIALGFVIGVPADPVSGLPKP